MCENELWCPECGLRAGKHVLRICNQLQGLSTSLKSKIGLFMLSLTDYDSFSHSLCGNRSILRGLLKGFKIASCKSPWGVSSRSDFIFYFSDINYHKLRRHASIMNNI